MTITPLTEKPLARGPWTCKPQPTAKIVWRAGSRYIELAGTLHPEHITRDWVHRNVAPPYNVLGACLTQNQIEAWAEFRHTLP